MGQSILFDFEANLLILGVILCNFWATLDFGVTILDIELIHDFGIDPFDYGATFFLLIKVGFTHQELV